MGISFFLTFISVFLQSQGQQAGKQSTGHTAFNGQHTILHRILTFKNLVAFLILQNQLAAGDLVSTLRLQAVRHSLCQIRIKIPIHQFIHGMTGYRQQIIHGLAGLCLILADLIGNTPLFEAKNIEKNSGSKARIFVKLERSNPAGSAKDRVALQMILDAEEKGLLL